jgi:hypothetical protein
MQVSSSFEGDVAKCGFQELSPPTPFSRRVSRASSANTILSASPATCDDDTRGVPSVSEASLSSNVVKRNLTTTSYNDIFMRRKEILKCTAMSRSMPCLRDVRTQYNRSIGKSVQVTETYSEHPLYDQWFSKLTLLDDNEDPPVINQESDVPTTVESIARSSEWRCES